MRIGVPREIKPDETRVALTPAAVRELVRAGAEVIVETGAGIASYHSDDDFAAQGATIARDADAVWTQAELIVKVKEPQCEEISRLGPDHVLFAYLHLAADATLTDGLRASGATAIALETITDQRGYLPLLAPMSEIAGCLSTQYAMQHLLAHEGGRGKLAGGVPGVPAARVLIIGAGVVGEAAARIAVGLGCETTVADRDVTRLRKFASWPHGNVRTVISTELTIDEAVRSSDVVIGAVLAPGARAPHVIRAEHLRQLGEGAVVLDVSIDQGGCIETSRPTTHSDPTFIEDGVVHSCVANLPAGVPSTATSALVNATLPYLLKFVTAGVGPALAADPGAAAGLNIVAGEIVCEAVAHAHATTSLSLNRALPLAA
jgi:alanine dehydrogenase